MFAVLRDAAFLYDEIRSAFLIVLRRWAMTMLVLPSSSLARAFWMIASVRVSTLLVASSRMRMRGSVRTALAKESSWRWPRLNAPPPSPKTVS